MGDREAREEWVLQAGGAAGDLLTRDVLLNGARLASVGGVVPPLPPLEARARDAFTAPARSVSFLRYPTLVPHACRGSE
eukprot:5247810-Prymnesium_polylepis.1